MHLTRAFAARSVAVGGALLFHLLVSRFLEIDEAGLVFVVVVWSTVLSIPSRLGIDGYLLALFPRLTASSRGLLRRLAALVATAGVLASGLVFVAATEASRSGVVTASHLLLLGASLLVVPYSLGLFNAALHKSLEQREFANFIEGGGGWAVAALALAATVALGVDPSMATVFGVAIGGHVALLSVSYIVVQRDLPSVLAQQPAPAAPLGIGTVLKGSMPFAGAAALNYLLLWLPVLAMGWAGRLTDVSQFNAVVRVGALVPFGLSVLNVYAAPRIAALHHERDAPGLQRLSWRVAGISSAFGALVVVGVAVAGRPLLLLFGEGYSEIWPGLLIFAAGQLVNASMGASSYLLQLTGSAKVLFQIVLFTVVTVGLAGALAGAAMGVYWAVAGTTCALVVQNLAVRWVVKRRLGLEANPRWVSTILSAARGKS